MSNPISRRTLLAAATGAVLATAVVPFAVSRAGPLAQVDLYDRTAGESLDIHRHRGQRYVVGRPGNEYAIRIRNFSDRRLLAVVSVDGVNAVTGETASPHQSGYVIEPGGYVNIQGWRKDLERTAAFYFSDPGDSYAARTGRPDDLGVIGVALFREHASGRPMWFAQAGDSVPSARERRGEAAVPAAPATGSAATASKSRSAGDAAPESAVAGSSPLGTGHGRGERSPAQQVAFERASSSPDELVTIRYERRETLVAMGVLPPSRHRGWRRDPDPFPATMGFVPDP